MSTAIEAEDLGFRFDSGRPALAGISFSVKAGECVGLVGANGAGKSTLLWCLLGLHKASGTLRLFGKPPTPRSLQRIGMVFQNPEDQLFMPSVLEDAVLPLVNRGVPQEAAQDRAREALVRAGLGEALDRPASRLSLGERKRASIAAALVSSPDLLLLDEPTAELDGRSVRQLATLLTGLSVTRLIASHHLEFLRGVCARLLVLEHGRLIAQGPAGEILGDRELLERTGLV